LTANLNRPGNTEELYLARAAEVTPHRPVLPGDVFDGIEIGGLGMQDAIIIVSHPCTMRAGAKLKPHLQAARITRDSHSIDLEAWVDGHFRVMPLPSLRLNSDDHHSAVLSEVGLVSSSALGLEKRTACLSELGIYLLQQRMVFCQTRARIGLDRFAEASQHVLEEAELLEEWSEALSPAETTNEESLLTTAIEFDEFLGQPPTASLRSKLELPRERPGVRRAIRAEIARRRA
jgi:hypothetical protein